MADRAGYLAFIRNMPIDIGNGTAATLTAIDLPDNDHSIDDSLAMALESTADYSRLGFCLYYDQLVYLLAFNNLVVMSCLPALAAIRSATGVDSMSSGFVQSASDVTTSASALIPDFFKNLSMYEMGLMKTPWGRRYLEIASRFKAIAMWGVS